ncbi:MAG TPA: FAD-dependent oxidoreductase [Patescibacteria group bacterium]|nr:FAD-dependent oxidoreductase [Patescibacteria group bacterium]
MADTKNQQNLGEVANVCSVSATVAKPTIKKLPMTDDLKPLFDTKVDAQEKTIPNHDVIMIGAGPTALTAAIYTTREDIETVLYEKAVIGGLAAVTDRVDNYPGFPDGIDGLELAENLRKQAERFGTKIELAEVTNIERLDDNIKVATTDGDRYARAVLIATGSEYKKLGIPGEDTYYARGVHYCATCDGAFYRNKKLVVVGGGNSAVQESLFLTRFASHIDLLVRSKLKASDVLLHQLEKNDKITVHIGVTIDEIIGDGKFVNKVIGTDVKSGKKVEFTPDGVFVFIGLSPNTAFLRTSGLEFDPIGFIKTDECMRTNLKGVFAAGDVRSGATMQIASAVGEGATAALRIREFLES